MRKILTIFKTIILTSSIVILPVACSKNPNNQSNIDISHIAIAPTSTNVKLRQDTYDTALGKFRKQVAKKITDLANKGQKPLYGRDYKIVVSDHDLYSKIEQYGLIDVTVQAAITTHILTGHFTGKVNLVKPAQNISNIKIANQNYDGAVIGITDFKETIVNLLAIIQTKISDLDNSVKKDIDYVVNVEGHELTEVVTKFGDVNINVNAINDDYHSLLIGAFTFVLTIS